MSNILYARRSSENEDHQTLSIDQQIFEMRGFAVKHGIEIDEILTKSTSAHLPGRPVFGDLMACVRAEKVHTLLA